MNEVSGIPGYRGYEYQIETTVWVALHIMLETESSGMIVVEPKSAEDAEIVLTADEATSTVVVDAGQTTRLILQFKTRSTGPWTKAAFSDVVGDGNRRPRKSRTGPAPRPRALEMLLQSSDTNYVLVTNAGLDSNIFGLSTTSLLDIGNTKIPSGILRLDRSTRSSALDGRIAILQSMTPELIAFRTRELLGRFGKVPHVSLDRCVTALKACIRDRLLGNQPSAFSIEELKKTLASQGGSPDNSSQDDSYSPPDDLARIQAVLAEHNVLLLVGPPGVGKSSLASHLANLHRHATLPYVVYQERISPGEIQRRLHERGPALFVISDPWGVSENEGRNPMAHELPNIIGHAGPDKRFLITSRNDVYDHANTATKLALKKFVVPFSVSNYGPDTLWRIAIHRFKDQQVALDMAQRFRSEILLRLKTPFELDLFSRLFCDISKENVEEWTEALDDHIWLNVQPWCATEDVMDLIATAGRAGSGQYARDILKNWTSNRPEYVAASWVLFESFETLAEAEFQNLLDAAGSVSSTAMRPHQFIQYLKDNGIAEDRDGQLIIHSFALTGMRDFLEPTEEVLLVIEKIVDHYVSKLSMANSIDAAGRAVRIIDTWEKGPARRTGGFVDAIAAIDQFLESRCLNSRDEEFLDAVFMSMWWKHSHNKFIQFVGSWGSDESHSSSYWTPPDLPPSVIEDVMSSGIAQCFLPLFVRDVMPNTSISYGHDEKKFVEFITQFEVDLTQAAHAALDLLYDRMYVDRGDGRSDDPFVGLNMKPLRALFTKISGKHYRDAPAPTRDCEL
ncbi:nSTAND3 domain-containing NTPase [Paraburkholderia strydomiana]|uniref:nSTAND3 domain-containing NTPase n=1 Tax=Paraburkholderia strydomiana TaxID=1245417 RepID=UPI0038BAF5D4